MGTSLDVVGTPALQKQTCGSIGVYPEKQKSFAHSNLVIKQTTMIIFNTRGY